MCMTTLLHALLLLLLFIGILGPPTFLLRRLIVAGCVGLNARGKQNSYYLLKEFCTFLHKYIYLRWNIFQFFTRIKSQTFSYKMKKQFLFCLQNKPNKCIPQTARCTSFIGTTCPHAREILKMSIKIPVVNARGCIWSTFHCLAAVWACMCIEIQYGEFTELHCWFFMMGDSVKGVEWHVVVKQYKLCMSRRQISLGEQLCKGITCEQSFWVCSCRCT